MKITQKKQAHAKVGPYKLAFTLVELIVVITILAILGTIAFISLQGYSSQARDSKRLSDIQNIKKSLELFSLNTGKYPEPDNYFTTSYGNQDFRYQGTVGDQVSTNLSRNLNKKPLDPLSESEYIYSRTYGGNEYELLSIYESNLISLSFPSWRGGEFFSQTNATPSRGANYPKIDGNYNGVFVKAGNYYLPTPTIINGNIWGNINLSENSTFLESQVITGGDNIPGVSTGGLVGFTIEVFSGTLDVDKGEDDNNNKFLLAQKLIDAYSGTILANEGVYKEIVETSSENFISLIDTIILKNLTSVSTSSNESTVSTPLITSLECSEAGWIWVEDDVYIGGVQGDGFCISPRFGDWQTNGLDKNDGAGGISWNGYGDSTATYFGGWDQDLVDDDLNASSYGQTRSLNSEVLYDCKALGTANEDFNIEDTIVGRMSWLTGTGNTYIEARNIDWITGLVPHTFGTYPHAIPALYIADCIDGEKNLTTDMSYKHRDGNTEEITYLEYNDNISSLSVDILDYETYQNRQKYLIAWTQEAGSHLPSAFSYIENGTAGGELEEGSLTNWDIYLNNSAKGEYQVACEAGKFGEYSGINQTSTNDQEAQEKIWTSAIGSPSGGHWAETIRVIGYDGCSNQDYYNSGGRLGNLSARFVIRP